MASVRVERMSAELGRLPHVCMCCGQPAASMAHHKFYYDPLWLATIGMLLPWYVRYHFASQSVVVPAPLCARHAGRLKLPTYLGYGFAASLLLAAPIMVLAVVLSNGMTTAAGIVFFLVFLYVIAALVGLMAVRLATPRMTAYDYRSITFGSVSSGFAEAITGRPLPGMYAASAAAAPGAFPAPGPAGHVQYPNYGPAPPLTRQQWIFIGAVTGSLAFVAFMMFFGVVYLRYRSGARHREEVARAQQWHNDQLAQFQEKQA
ncbi:MAG TPA: hypothetical protein VFV87_02205, partial [Pirellulaceae bacterium]|nr:hypothetical protein [Pirellulaceae bacterium]